MMPAGSIVTATRSPTVGCSSAATTASSRLPSESVHAQTHDGALPRRALDDPVSRGAVLHDRDRDRLRPDHPRPVGGLEDVREPEEARDVLVRRVRPELVGRPRLHDPSATHDRDPVAERERLALVVRDVERRDPELGEEALEILEQAVAE